MGWGVVVVVAGALIDLFSGPNPTEKNYLPAFLLTLGLLVMDMGVVTRFKVTTSLQVDFFLRF